MRHQSNTAFSPFLLSACPDHHRLFQEWTKALKRFTLLAGRIHRRSFPSLDDYRQLCLQMENADNQVRDAWLLFRLHRFYHGCTQDPTASVCTETAPLPVIPASVLPVPQSVALDSPQKTDQRIGAAQRREQQLQELVHKGVPIVFHGRWHASIGPLHIWPHAGRWTNEATRKRGKILRTSMHTLIWREVIEQSGHGVQAELKDALQKAS